MSTVPPATHRDEPAFLASAARLALLADPTRSGMPSMPAMLLQYAHNELTDYGGQVPRPRTLELEESWTPGSGPTRTTLVGKTSSDLSAAVQDTLSDLIRLLADAGDLPEALRLTRAIDYTREALAAFHLHQLHLHQVPHDVDEAGEPW